MDQITDLEDGAEAERALDATEQRLVRMSPDGKTGSSIQIVLRRRLDEIAQAIRDRNIDLLMTFYASDVTVFDVLAPLNVKGAATYRENFEKWFASFEGPLGFDLHALRVVPGDNAAFCHYLALVSGARADNGASGYWVRGTTCFERRDGEWLVSHEHMSMPSST